MIPDCSYLKDQNYILAPEGTAEGLLQQYDFQQNENGFWYKIPNHQEYEIIMKGWPNYDIIFSFDHKPVYKPNSEQPVIFHDSASKSESIFHEHPEFQEKPEIQGTSTGNVLCIIALLLLCLSFLSFIVSQNDEFILPGIGAILLSCILTIIVRLRYPENLFGKILFGIHVLIFILLILAMIEVILECVQCLNSC